LSGYQPEGLEFTVYASFSPLGSEDSWVGKPRSVEGLGDQICSVNKTSQTGTQLEMMNTYRLSKTCRSNQSKSSSFSILS